MKLQSSSFQKEPCDLSALPASTALLVIDMQRDFTAPERLPPECAQLIGEITRPLQRLISACREVGLPVIYTQEKHRPDFSDFGIELDYEPDHCIEGTGGEEVIPALAPRPGEVCIVKRRYSALYQTDLELYLRSTGIRRLLMTGVFLDVCVLHTAFDAKARDFWIYVPRECTTAETQQRTDATFEIIDAVLGYVGSVEDILRALAAARPQGGSM